MSRTTVECPDCGETERIDGRNGLLCEVCGKDIQEGPIDYFEPY